MAMDPQKTAVLRLGVLVIVVVVLCFIFPSAFKFVEMAARELRYFWWLILVVALAIWLIWGVGRKRG
jgi:hypothetical protein